MLVPIESSLCDFLLVINTNLTAYLAPFPRYSIRLFRQVQNRYIWLPLLRLTSPRTEEFTWDDLRKFIPKS